jgi:hypothetical protein
VFKRVEGSLQPQRLQEDPVDRRARISRSKSAFAAGYWRAACRWPLRGTVVAELRSDGAEPMLTGGDAFGT